jgi:hypothetical protein
MSGVAGHHTCDALEYPATLGRSGRRSELATVARPPRAVKIGLLLSKGEAIVRYLRKMPRVKLESVFACHLSDTKNLTYQIDSPRGSFDLSVTVPYHPDDREADRLGRLEVHKLLNSGAP